MLDKQDGDDEAWERLFAELTGGTDEVKWGEIERERKKDIDREKEKYR